MRVGVGGWVGGWLGMQSNACSLGRQQPVCLKFCLRTQCPIVSKHARHAPTAAVCSSHVLP